MWVVSGEQCYAENAVDIIRAWAATNKTNQGRNAPLVRHKASKKGGSGGGLPLRTPCLDSPDWLNLFTPRFILLHGHASAPPWHILARATNCSSNIGMCSFAVLPVDRKLLGPWQALRAVLSC